jgi:hypothetical protein
MIPTPGAVQVRLAPKLLKFARKMYPAISLCSVGTQNEAAEPAGY